jgi:cytochrome c-type biogenesis protein
LEVTIGLAFIAGLASFLSPCVFSLVPAYIGYLSGRSLSILATDKLYRWNTLIHGMAFVIGFSIVFIILGLAVSALGKVLFDIRYVLSKIGGILVIFFGLHMTGIVRIPFLYYDLRPRSKFEKQRSFLSSMLMGIFFSAGWSPCIGPVLGSILTLAFNNSSIVPGGKLLAAYSAGLGIPFLLTAVAIDKLTGRIKKFQKFSNIVEIVMGGVLVIIGILLFFGIYERVAQINGVINFGL